MKPIKVETILDQKKVYSHVIFLLVSLAIVAFSFITSEGVWDLGSQVKTSVLIFLYLEVFILLSRFFFHTEITDITEKKFLRNILSRFLLFYLACFFSALVIIILFRYFTFTGNERSLSLITTKFFNNEFSNWFSATIKGLTFGAVLFLFIQFVEALKKSRQLKEENLIFQNETLKNQINPHFLFNSLNTLSSLIGTKPDLAEVFIHKFSGVYRYILENINEDIVSLNTEFDFVGNYFELHKIRDEEKIALDINREGAEDYGIPPVSLQILIENAIKHNMATREKPLKIEIFIENDCVVVRNNLQKMAHQLTSSGIGLKNLKERIKLISNRDLVVEETKKEFIVKMPLLK